MKCVKVSYEGKFKIDELLQSKYLLSFLTFLVNDRCYAVQKWDHDEIKLTKHVFQRQQEGEIEFASKDTSIEIEVEIEDTYGEIEVKCENADLVKETIDELNDFFNNM